MKHLKKFVSLVLVLASVLSIALSAGAATIEYKDAKKITSETAVGVLTGLGVVEGYDGKNFMPLESVTRGQLAKMMAITLNGGKDIGDDYVAFCSFADSVGHWAEKYIGYCAAFGLINGRNADTFDPEANVTGYEASNIMLRTLGYDPELNDLVGKKWDTSSHALAIEAKLLVYINDYDPAKKLNRNDACQMLFNALCATMVKTDSFGENIAKPSNGTDYTGVEDDKLQLVENTIPTLRKASDTHDSFGRPSSTWTLAGKELGTFLTTQPIFKDDVKTNAKAIRSLIDGEIPKTVVFYKEGKRMGNVGYEIATIEKLEEKMELPLQVILAMSNADFWAKAAKKIPKEDNGSLIILAQMLRNTSTDMNFAEDGKASGTAMIGNSKHNEIFYDAETGEMTVCSSPYYVNKIVAVHAEYLQTEKKVIAKDTLNSQKTVSKTSFAPLELSNGEIIDGDQLPIALNILETGLGQKPVEGGYVAYYVGAVGSTFVALGAKLLQYTEGKVETIKQTAAGGVSSFVVDGETYQRANQGPSTYVKIGQSLGIHYLALNANFTFFLEPPSESRVYVSDAGRMTTGNRPTPTAEIVDTEGFVNTVPTDKNYGPTGSDNLVGCIAVLSSDRTGRTVLTPLKDAKDSGKNPEISVTNSVAAVNLNGNSSLIANTATTFVVSTLDDNGKEIYNVYYGICEVPTITACEYLAYYAVDDGKPAVPDMLETVFIQNAILDSTSFVKKEGVLFKTGSDLSRTSEFGTYFELPAIIDNEPTTLKVSTAVWNQLPNGFTLFSTYKLGEGGAVTRLYTLSATKINRNGFTPVEFGNVTINGEAIMAHENVLVYTYSLREKALAVSSIYDLQELQYGTYNSYYTRHEKHSSKLLACVVAIVE